jgi:hypothetical protein
MTNAIKRIVRDKNPLQKLLSPQGACTRARQKYKLMLIIMRIMRFTTRRDMHHLSPAGTSSTRDLESPVLAAAAEVLAAGATSSESVSLKLGSLRGRGGCETANQNPMKTMNPMMMTMMRASCSFSSSSSSSFCPSFFLWHPRPHPALF